MKNIILGILTEKQDVTPLLLGGLQDLEPRLGDAELGIATVVDGRIMSRKTSGNVPDLENVLPTPSAPSQFGIAYQYSSQIHENLKEQAQLYATDDIAVVYSGFLDNFFPLQGELEALGYECETQTDAEVILRFLMYYLNPKLGISLSKAMKLTLHRLEGHCSIMTLVAQPEPVLLAAHRACSLAIGASKESLYLGFNTQAVKKRACPVIQIEEEYPLILRSV